MLKKSVVLVLFIVQGMSLAGEDKRGSDLQVTFTLAKPEYVLDEPVILVCEVANQSGDKLVVDLGLDRLGNFDFTCVDKDKKVITGIGIQPGGLHMLGNVEIGGMKSFKQHIVLNRWIAFADPDSYTVNCSLQVKDKKLGNLLSIKIIPTDSEKLRSSADSMLEKIEKKEDWGEEMLLSEAMSFFTSPVVIPQLKRAVQLGEREVIKAFRRMGGIEAMEALRELSNSRYREIAIAAKGELKLLEKGVRGELYICD